MNTDFLSPVSEKVIANLVDLPAESLGRKIMIHSVEDGFPDLEDVSVALVGVKEGRESINNLE